MSVTDDGARGSVRLKVKDGVALVRVADPSGKLHEFYTHYGQPAILPPWATHDDSQVRHLLDNELVELVDEQGRALDPGRVWECVSALVAVGLPADAGGERAREALRRNGLHYRNQTICEAVRLRKSHAKYEAPA
ncbi:hypothetical protein [uncultured Mycobacterium sp.]|uniref:hypothetical protein n=1 Tax=uncultured Mycobacterium sp. TaxID=171292 RepID=UPI0035CB1D0D